MTASKLNAGVAKCVGALAQTTTEREPVCAYLYDLDALRAHVTLMVTKLGAKCRLYYAIKANPDRRLIACLAPLVAGFEAASIGEIRVIREISTTCPILFGGPGKKLAEIEQALALGISTIHIESLLELRRVQYVAERCRKIVSILLRVNLRDELPEATVTMAGRPTQFGIDEMQLPSVLDEVRRCTALRLDGFHLHSISNNLDARLHARLVATYLRRIHAWAQRFGLDIRVINAGGGFGVSYDDRRDFDWAGFMGALRPVLAANPLPNATLNFEPGRFLTAFCGYYAAEVIDIKTNHDRHYAIVRGGTHHLRLPASWKHNHPFQIISCDEWPYPFERPAIENTRVTLAGELCTPKDVLAEQVRVSRLRVGDVLVFLRAGAYGWTISHHDFLGHPHPQHLYIDSEGEPT